MLKVFSEESEKATIRLCRKRSVDNCNYYSKKRKLDFQFQVNLF